jgi:hypothetical protein
MERVCRRCGLTYRGLVCQGCHPRGSGARSQGETMNTSAMRVRNEYFSNVNAAVTATVADPRAANCRGFQVDGAGKVIGIHLVHVSVPSAMYELVRAELIDEYAAQGQTVVTAVVLDADGIQVAERVKMAWPFPQLNADGSPAGPGNPQNQFAITSKFPENTVGPLAFAVYDVAGNLIGDVVGGYGQVLGRGHIGGRVTFRKRSTPTPDPTPDPVPDTGSGARIAVALERLATHLGA